MNFLTATIEVLFPEERPATRLSPPKLETFLVFPNFLPQLVRQLVNQVLFYFQQVKLVLKHKVPKCYDQYCLKNSLLLSTLSMIQISEKSPIFAQKRFYRKTTNSQS